MDSETEQTFAKNLQARRQARGWSQGELARQMNTAGWDNYSQMTVSRTEKSERPVRLAEAVDLALVLGTTLESLLAPAFGAANAHKMLLDMRSVLISASQELELALAKMRTYVIEARSTLRSLDGLEVDDEMASYIERLEGDIERIIYAAETTIDSAGSYTAVESSGVDDGEHPEAPER